MRFPWTKREERAETYTDAVIEVLQSESTGTKKAGPQQDQR